MARGEKHAELSESEEGSGLREDTTTLVPIPSVSRCRWWILALLFVITVINFIDRQTLSVLAPVIRASFHLSNTQYGRIVSAFQFGMMSGEIPMGALMDRIGARIGLALAVFWWSSATGAQFLARNGVQFGLTRFWMGTGECGNFSGGVKTVTRLFAKSERTLAIGIFNGGSMVGATIAPPLIVYLLHRYGFRAAFLVPALCGIVWLPLWWWAFRRRVPSAPTLRTPRCLRFRTRRFATRRSSLLLSNFIRTYTCPRPPSELGISARLPGYWSTR